MAHTKGYQHRAQTGQLPAPVPKQPVSWGGVAGSSADVVPKKPRKLQVHIKPQTSHWDSKGELYKYVIYDFGTKNNVF